MSDMATLKAHLVGCRFLGPGRCSCGLLQECVTARTGFPSLVAAELAKAHMKHRGIQSLHEGYAVVLEEMDELWDEIRAQTVDRDKVLNELIQVAAMCQRFAEDCSLRGAPHQTETPE